MCPNEYQKSDPPNVNMKNTSVWRTDIHKNVMAISTININLLSNF